MNSTFPLFCLSLDLMLSTVIKPQWLIAICFTSVSVARVLNETAQKGPVNICPQCKGKERIFLAGPSVSFFFLSIFLSLLAACFYLVIFSFFPLILLREFSFFFGHGFTNHIFFHRLSLQRRSLWLAWTPRRFSARSHGPSRKREWSGPWNLGHEPKSGWEFRLHFDFYSLSAVHIYDLCHMHIISLWLLLFRGICAVLLWQLDGQSEIYRPR